MTVRTRRRPNLLALGVPLFAAAVIGFGFALDRWVIADGIETVSEPAAMPPAVVSPAATSPAAPAAGPARQSHVDDAQFADLFARGIAGLRAGRPDQAAEAFDAARRLNPNVPALHVNLGFARLALDQVDAAIASFEAAISLRPGQINAYYGLAEGRERQGDMEAALGAMRTFVHLAPEDDRFRRRALSAIWEWETALGQQPSSPLDTAQAKTGPLAQSKGPGLLAAPLDRLDGGTETLARFAGKTLILNVWATWCAPCRAELPSLQRLSDKLDPQRYAVVGLSTDRDPDYVREFLNETGVRYPNYLDPGKDVTYGILKMESYPQTLLIRPDGTIAETIVGARAWDGSEMVANIRDVQ